MRDAGGDHALLEVPDRGQEDGRRVELAVEGHLRQVLVVEVEAVRAPGLVVVRLVDLRELLAAAAVAGDGAAGEARRRLEEAGVDQGARQRDEARRVAPGVRAAGGSGDAAALRRVELGEAVLPGRVRAVRGGGVDDLDVVAVVDERHGLDGRVVGQAEHDGVRAVDRRLARGRVLARDRVDGHDLDPRVRAQAVEHLEARRAGLAVDEDLLLGAQGRSLCGGARRRDERGCYGG